MRHATWLMLTLACLAPVTSADEPDPPASSSQRSSNSQRVSTPQPTAALPLPAWNVEEPAARSGNQPIRLLERQLTESSGLAFSRRKANRVWSHNDSGGRARLFCFNDRGQATGSVTLAGVRAVDWEAMDCFQVNGRPYLLAADVGDNDRRRGNVKLYIFSEPDPDRHQHVNAILQLNVTYQGGTANCEAVAVDAGHKQILLLSKSPLLSSLHRLDLPEAKVVEENTRQAGLHQFTLNSKWLAAVPLPLVTGMDICPQTGDIWACNYLHAIRFAKLPGKTIAVQIQQSPEMISLPRLRQVEAIAVDQQGRPWVTSEGYPTPLQRVVRTE